MVLLFACLLQPATPLRWPTIGRPKQRQPQLHIKDPLASDVERLADDYLSGLSRVADDGRSLLRAPQRYSSRQWRANIGSIATCRILRAVRGQLLWQLAWALAISLVYIYAGRAVPTLPALPHSLLGGVMGVLLGFRTNQSCTHHTATCEEPAAGHCL